MSELFFEDLAVGARFGSGRRTIEAARIKAFAAEFDPQPFHLDGEAAKGSVFGGLAASGWHTAALTMRLLVESEFKPAGGIIAAAIDELTWPRPVRPGDELRVESEILETRRSRSRADRGMLKVRVTTFDQANKVVQSFIAHLLVPTRATAERPSL
jgi:acyl dehydratase